MRTEVSFIQSTQAQKPSKEFSKSLLTWLSSKIGVWRLALLVFMLAYASALLLNLGYMSIQWDEVPHLYGGLFLLRGQTQLYMATYGYYPPLFDIITVVFYQTLGVSATSGRAATVMFSLLSIWLTFEFAQRNYGSRTGLVAAMLLGVTPGFFWLSRVTMLETALIFFFTLSLFFFSTWLSKNKDKPLILSCIALGIGFLAKYQIVVAGIVMIVTILWLGRDKLKIRFTKFLLVPIIAAAVILPWALILYQANGGANFTQLLYVIQEGGQDRAQYSGRFPMPVFYLIEMTWPFKDIPVHPISLPLYALSLLGLALLAWRRKPSDKFLLSWFAVVYIFFTFIPNKQWRYVTPLFPMLAISAAGFALFLCDKVSFEIAKKKKLNGNQFKRISSVFLAVLVFTVALYSSFEAYQMTARDQIHIPLQETANYIASHMKANESAVIVCAFNLLNKDMLQFYLPANMSQNQIWQYPELPVDAFTPNFNITEFINLCQRRNVKYSVLYDYGANSHFFNSPLTYSNITTMLYESGRFGYTGDEPFFGEMPHRTFLVGFHKS